MSGDEQSCLRFLESTSWKEVVATRDQLWREELLSGEETEEEAVYRLRLHSVEKCDFKAVICDRCDERPAHGGVLAFGSAEWILAGADAKGWAVPKRWALEVRSLVLDDLDLAPVSMRTFALCASCQPIPTEYGAVKVVVEPGYEESLEAFVRWQSGGQDF